MHQYLQVFTKNATENTVVMIKKAVNKFLSKWVEEKLEIIDRGQDIQAQVMFSIISTCYIQAILDTNHSILPVLLILLIL